MAAVTNLINAAWNLWDGLSLSRAALELPPPEHQHDDRRSWGEQRIMVTGGTSGIGLEVVKLLCGRGHRVVVPCRSDESRKVLQSAHLGEVWQADYDLLDLKPKARGIFEAPRDPMAEFCAWVKERFGKLDALVLCAGETGLDWQNLSRRKVWEKVFLWVESHARLIDNAIPLLHDFDQPKDLRGRIIFVSSAMADAALPSVEPYGEIKRETEEMLVDTFMQRYPDKRLQNILPIIIRPGSVATRMHEEVLAKGSPELRARTEKLKLEGLLHPVEDAGKIIAGIALTGCIFSPDALMWDRPINRAEKVRLTEEHYSAMREHASELAAQLPEMKEPK